MILSHQKTSVPELDADFTLRSLVHPRYRVQFVCNKKVISDDALLKRALAPERHISRPVIMVVLEGRARMRAYGSEKWLGPGDVGLAGCKEAIEMRREGEMFRSIMIEWDPERGLGEHLPASLEVATVQPILSKLGSCVERLLDVETCTDEAAVHLHDVLALLAVSGMPLRAPPPSELIALVSPQEAHLSRALDVALSELSAQPMVIDLTRALGVSARHVSRLVSSFNERYGFTSRNWCGTRTRRRLQLAAGFMALDGATTELVARRVGYMSPSAFCRALALAGLPSPRKVREAVRSLQ